MKVKCCCRHGACLLQRGLVVGVQARVSWESLVAVAVVRATRARAAENWTCRDARIVRRDAEMLRRANFCAGEDGGKV